MRRKLLFVGGIHGAGKTTYCRRLAERVGAQHYSAGKLISDARNLEQKNKVVADVEENQDALLCALSHVDDGPTILDGHFCLLGSDDQISLIPLPTFEGMAPTGFAVLTVSAEEAHRRLLKRDGRAPDASVLVELQKQEITRARTLAGALGVPLHFSERLEDIVMFASAVLHDRN